MIRDDKVKAMDPTRFMGILWSETNLNLPGEDRWPQLARRSSKMASARKMRLRQKRSAATTRPGKKCNKLHKINYKNTQIQLNILQSIPRSCSLFPFRSALWWDNVAEPGEVVLFACALSRYGCRVLGSR